MNISLVVHGGADPRTADAYSPARQAAMRAALGAALRAGHAVLRDGGTSLDAVVAAVGSLEDCGQFDAGRGAYRNVDGGFDLDAAIMDGRTGAAGSAAHVHHVKNPVRLARAVMDGTAHVLLVAEGAERFALDTHGNLAAATSTGGIHERLAGRVGDAPIIGAGTYADNRSAAISCTGEGEYFLRAVLAHEIAARVEHGGRGLAEAAEAALREKITGRGGKGGLIGVDIQGNPVAVFNTPTMARGSVVGADGTPRVALFADEG